MEGIDIHNRESKTNLICGNNTKLIIILVLFLLSLLFFVLFAKCNKNQNLENTNQSTQSAKYIDTTNWNTYQNEKWNYSAKYPNNWNVKTEFDVENSNLNKTDYRYVQKTGIIKNNYKTSYIISVWDKEPSFSLNDWIVQYQLNLYGDYLSTDNFKEVVVSNQHAILLPLFKNDSSLQQYLITFIEKDGIVYRIFYAGESLKEYFTMLSNFSIANTGSNYNLPDDLLFNNVRNYSFDERGNYTFQVKDNNHEIFIAVPVHHEMPEKYYETIGDVILHNINSLSLQEEKLTISSYIYNNLDKNTYVSLVYTSVIESGWNEETKDIIEIEISEIDGVVTGKLVGNK